MPDQRDRPEAQAKMDPLARTPSTARAPSAAMPRRRRSRPKCRAVETIVPTFLQPPASLFNDKIVFSTNNYNVVKY